MFKLIHLIPVKSNINFMSKRYIAFVISTLLICGTIFLHSTKGLNYGIDFSGGISIEVKTNGPSDIEKMRKQLKSLNPELQAVGTTGDIVAIRVGIKETDDQMKTVANIKSILGNKDVEYRNVEVVGPKVGKELIRSGLMAVIFSLLAIAFYIWVRFELPFAVGALVALFHDVITTIGLFALTGMEFNLTTVAAILTIAGYSINDTVVSYDRIRENLKRYRKRTLMDIINSSTNETLSRTMLTSVTTLIAVLSVFFFGGDVLSSFSAAMIWGIVIGTYSSIFIAIPVLIFFDLKDEKLKPQE